MAAVAAILDFRLEHFSYFWPTSHYDTSYQVSSQLLFGSGEEVQNRILRWPPWRPSGISYLKDLSYFSVQNTPILPTQFGLY